jgi:hypothetical protein
MPDGSPSRLLKVLGVAFGLAIIVGNFIGDQANSIRAVVVIAASYPLYLLAKRVLRH